MNLEQILISALDAEIEEYEKTLNFLPEPEFSLKHSRVIAKAVRIANKDVTEQKNTSAKSSSKCKAYCCSYFGGSTDNGFICNRLCSSISRILHGYKGKGKGLDDHFYDR